MLIAPVVRVSALAFTALLLSVPAAGAQVSLVSHGGFTTARTVAQAGTATNDQDEEVFDFPGGHDPFRFDEAAAPDAAHDVVGGDSADATAGTVFHAEAIGGGSQPLKIDVSGNMSSDATVHDDPPTISTHAHFGQADGESFADIGFRVVGGPARFTISGSATGDEPNNFADLRGGFEPGSSGVTTYAHIEPGAPASGVTGMVPPGSYSFRVRMTTRALAQNSGPLSDDDTASGSYNLEVEGGDTDGDALPDQWETNGVDTDGDGTIDLDLPAMGADPRHKDIFVELDFMPPHRLALEAGRLITTAFADAPVTNPDGTTGIALHLDNGADSVMNPRTGATWGGLSRQNALIHQNVLGSIGPTGHYDWGPFDALKSTSFESRRAGAFHYAISGHGHDGRGSGIARDIPSSDLLMTLGAGCAAINGGVDCTLDPMAQAGTLMHELGHNLGLHHGGADDLVRKPNYLSVMNYAFQLTGLMRANSTFVLDYSRFAIPLDESALDEGNGFGITSGPAALLNTTGKCPSGAPKLWAVFSGFTDFDCDGANGGVVSSDVTGDGKKTPLPGFTDWPALVYAGGAIGDAGAVLPATTERMEPPLDELLETKRFLEERATTQPPVVPPQTGAGTSTPTPPAAVKKPPVVTKLRARVRRRVVKVGLRLSEAARVRILLERCRNRRCTRRSHVGRAVRRKGRVGRNSFSLKLRKPLAPGRYRVVATPTADGRHGVAVRRTFLVRRPLARARR